MLIFAVVKLNRSYHNIIRKNLKKDSINPLNCKGKKSICNDFIEVI